MHPFQPNLDHPVYLIRYIPRKKENILKLLEDNTQTIITNTDLTDIKNRGINTNLPSNKDFYLEKIWKN